ncbi:serine protease [Phlyctochytrium planicorne]|nr:serine protease [Phlyctochytrium planicorne]
MKVFAILAVTIAIATSFAQGSPQGSDERPAPGTPIPGKYIIVFKDTATDAQVQDHHTWLESAVANSTLARRSTDQGEGEPYIEVKKFDCKGGKNKDKGSKFHGYSGNIPDDVIDQVKSQEQVAYVEQDSVVTIADMSLTFGQRYQYSSPIVQTNVPNWGLRRLAKPDLPLSDSYTFDNLRNSYIYGNNTSVYTLDTGVDENHPEFRIPNFGPPDSLERLTHFWAANLITPTNIDGHGHGTHIAGIITSLNYGVAKYGNVLAVKVLNDQGVGAVSDIINGLIFLSNQMQLNRNKKVVINLSIAAAANDALDQIVNVLIDQNAIIVAAAGNQGQDACAFSPARVPRVVTVAASRADDSWAPFSNYGPCVDIVAPGDTVYSTWPGNRVNWMSGTSVAAAHVTGVLSTILTSKLKAITANYDAIMAEFNSPRFSVTGKITGVPANTANRLLQTLPPAQFVCPQDICQAQGLNMAGCDQNWCVSIFKNIPTVAGCLNNWTDWCVLQTRQSLGCRTQCPSL